MRMKIILFSLFCYWMGCFMTRFCVYGNIKWQARIDKRFFFLFPTILIVAKEPRYLKGFDLSIEFYFLIFNFRLMLKKGIEGEKEDAQHRNNIQ